MSKKSSNFARKGLLINVKMSVINFSVVIPLYNKQNAITATLHSVLAQTYQKFEIIVVDDGSKDDSASRVRAINDPRIRLIQKENGGVSSARNRGIKEAKYDYVALLDGDDLWDENFLIEHVKLIQDFSDAKMWGVNYAFVKYGSSIKCNQGLGNKYRGYIENYFGTKHNDLFCSSSVVIQKDIFDEVGYFDERIASSEDLDMWYRIILRYPVVFYDNVLAYYNQDAENRVAYDTDMRFPLTKDIKYYFDKYSEICKTNSTFSHYMNNFVASGLLNGGFYFGRKQERLDSDVIVKKLRYQDIHIKYHLIFKTPRWFGWLMYQIICLKKRVI